MLPFRNGQKGKFMDITRPTVMEIDLDAFEYNVNQIQKYIGENIEIMPVLKANAYGTNINFLNTMTSKFKIIAVAIVDEAVMLRNYGYSGEILVLNQPSIDEIDKILDYNVTIGICEEHFLEEIANFEKKIKIHIEIDTGMGRTGINPERIIEFIDKVKLYSNITVDGIYTHFSSADIDFDYTKKQINLFNKCIKKAKEMIHLKYIHASASNGILNFPECNYNLVRPGIILYGYEASEETYKKISLKPVCKLKSKIIYLKEVDSNISIGYSRRYVTNRKTKIATIPIGYADGFPRVSNKGFIVVNDQRAPIIGTVCMDSMMVDVTNIEDVYINQDVYIWDNDLIKLKDIADLTGTINYEIISRISQRVPREFVKG